MFLKEWKPTDMQNSAFFSRLTGLCKSGHTRRPKRHLKMKTIIGLYAGLRSLPDSPMNIIPGSDADIPYPMEKMLSHLLPTQSLAAWCYFPTFRLARISVS